MHILKEYFKEGKDKYKIKKHSYLLKKEVLKFGRNT